MNPSLPQFDFDAARKIPSNIRFGTSTWTYPGWKGMIYQKTYRNEKEFRANCLEEYATFPWFRTVGIDHSFYTPPNIQTLERYAQQTSPDFRWISKVWDTITIPSYPKHARYGKLAGTTNQEFLNAELFTAAVLERFDRPTVRNRTGPFVFQFPTMPRQFTGGDFLAQLELFLQRLPKQFSYAVEVRNPELLNDRYFKILNNAGVTHCFNHWHIMPALHEQMRRAAAAGGLEAKFFVARILTPLGVKYEEAVKLFQPYSELKQPNPEMRKDVIRLAHRALELNKEAYIIVNNRAEGNAPLTIDAIGREIANDL